MSFRTVIKTKSLELFSPIDDDREYHLILSVREYNGIDSDPNCHHREPTVTETIDALEKILGRFRHIPTRSSLP